MPQIIDEADRSHDDWVLVQLEDKGLRPTKVIEKLMEQREVPFRTATYIVDRADRYIRKKKARKETWIGLAVLFLGSLLLLLTYYISFAVLLAGILKTGNGLYKLVGIRRETNG